MKGLKRILFAATIFCLTATMMWAVPAAQAQMQPADMAIIKTTDNPAANPVDQRDRDRRNTPAPKITYEQAAEIALKEVGGGYVKEIDLEYKHRYNRLVYEVEVRKDHAEFDVEIDAETGEVLKVKRD